MTDVAQQQSRLKDLIAIGKIGEASERARVCAMLSDGRARSMGAQGEELGPAELLEYDRRRLP